MRPSLPRAKVHRSGTGNRPQHRPVQPPRPARPLRRARDRARGASSRGGPRPGPRGRLPPRRPRAQPHARRGAASQWADAHGARGARAAHAQPVGIVRGVHTADRARAGGGGGPGEEREAGRPRGPHGTRGGPVRCPALPLGPAAHRGRARAPDQARRSGMKEQRHHRWSVRILLAVAVLTGLVGMFAVWANRQALNTDNWTDTSSKLLADQNIQKAVGGFLVDELFTSVNVQQELQSVLPPQAQALAGPAAAGLRQLADQRAPQFIARPKVQNAWRNANRVAHKELLTILNGNGKTLTTTNGQVVLNLHVLVDQLASQLGVEQQVQAARAKAQGGAGAQGRQALQQKAGITLPPSTGQLTIMKSDNLKTAQDVAQGIRHLAIVLTVVTLGLFALAVWLARGWRRVAFRSVGWCFLGLGIVVLFARRVVGDRIVDSLATSETVKPAAHDVWTIGTSLLYGIAVAFVIYGVVIVFSAWLAGETRSATAVRRALAPPMRERPAMVYGAVALVYVLVLLWGPTYATRKLWGIVLLGALVALGVEILRRQCVREFPDAKAGEITERMKAWFADRRERRRAAPAAAVDGG